MHIFKATESEYQVKASVNDSLKIYPLLRDDKGSYVMYGISPIHGRSFVMKQRSDTDWVVSKGNGLCYSNQSFIVSDRVDDNIWGALPLKAALRDFKLGEEIRKLGVKTNRMECVVELEKCIGTKEKNFKASLLQYSVECPYRICDIAFAPRHVIENAIKHWQSPHAHPYDYLKAAEILVSNLRTLHSNSVMHNAMHAQNYTWALELLDFEASRSDNMPYDNPAYEEYVPLLIRTEIIQTYEIINYIAWCLGEPIDYAAIDAIFRQYGYDFSSGSTIDL